MNYCICGARFKTLFREKQLSAASHASVSNAQVN
jgi:hypothetical protein